ncbi:hypothetical protein FEM48_Zijuj09G0121100 [Ziziphus jujuba var. spinosa]|uniref:Uncharacterized protein n=1 Tax=Ziziphus jujuba var. spinosa TaxID=714518 RepID=A0A978USX2_ZIZJJ|nr:hypothetical protein FEM48_Zijuj09G0121100 [Ziziphus jujuba var. spinosa]
MDPRISFSNDFADTTQLSIKHDNIYREAPVSSDFEFSVNNYKMISADEAIFEGMLLPLKDNSTNQPRKTTLKDELLLDDDDEDNYEQMFLRPSKSLGRWKERLGLKKAHILSKKANKNDGILERVVEEERTSMFVHEAALITKEAQELLFDGGLRCKESAI